MRPEKVPLRGSWFVMTQGLHAEGAAQ